MKILPGTDPRGTDPRGADLLGADLRGTDPRVAGTGSWSRTLFLDRDGTLMQDVGYPRDPEQVVLLPGVGSALAQCRAAGYRLVIVSNQSGVGRRYFPWDAVVAVHQRLLDLLADEGALIDAGYYCPHAPEQACQCRKPEPFMLLQAAAQHGINLRDSVMLGDKLADVECGQRAGCRSIWFAGQAQYGVVQGADFVVQDWPEAAALLTGSAFVAH